MGTGAAVLVARAAGLAWLSRTPADGTFHRPARPTLPVCAALTLLISALSTRKA
ncbi:hypothetical protein ACFVHW_33265 [Streptomyces sp. NPDC127110]|uniref:hypothetical protein n=1 Tax=Streptomyces sp. NPDC127110 TaxID=3345362 RepID=UPI00362596E4